MSSRKHPMKITACLGIVSALFLFSLSPSYCEAQEAPEKILEIRAGWGSSPPYGMIELHMYDTYYPDGVDLTEMLPISDKYTINPVSLEVAWPISRRWDTGGRVVYNQTWQKFVEGSVASYYFSAEAMIRYNIVKREFFRLYASASCGPFVATRVERTDYPSRQTEATFIPAELYLGFSGGKRIFGFCEIGFGTGGTLRGGVGYRFNNVAP